VPPRAEQFDEVDPAVAARWHKFGASGETRFPQLLGLTVEEVRDGYCRMRMPFRAELLHAGGVVHGGALASLLDSVLVPAIGVSLPVDSVYSTVDLHVQFVDGLVDEDAVAEGWIVRRGRRTVFGESEAFAVNTGRLIARAISPFGVRPG
jgi:acyl-CoA thioesterase